MISTTTARFAPAAPSRPSRSEWPDKVPVRKMRQNPDRAKKMFVATPDDRADPPDPAEPWVEIGANVEGSPFQPVRGPGGPGDRGSPRSASGSRSGPDCGARGRRQPERLEEAQGPDGRGAPADHGPRGGGRRRRGRRGRCGRGRRRSRVRLRRRGAAQAELAVLSCYAPVPPSLDFPGAAALPAAIETATRALGQLGAGSGSTLLINGASGSVGSAAVQSVGNRGRARRTGRCRFSSMSSAGGGSPNCWTTRPAGPIGNIEPARKARTS